MEERLERGERSTIISFFLTLITSAVKIVGGILTRTGVLLADGIHSLFDSLTILTSFVSIRLIKRKPSERFPYGLYKVENLFTIFVCVLLYFMVYELLFEGFEEVSRNAIPYAAFSVILSFAIFFVQYTGFKKSRLESLRIISLESLFDISISLLAFLIILFNLRFIQKPFIIGMAVMVLFLGTKAIYNSILALLDVAPEKEVLEAVLREVEGVDGVKRVKDIKLRRSGPYILGDIVIETLPGIPVSMAHEITEEIERKISRYVRFVNIHVEPFKGKLKVAIPLEDGKISERFSGAKKFLIIDDGERIVENPFWRKEIRKGVAVVNFLKEMGVDAVIVRNIGTIGYNLLKSNLIEVYRATGEDPKENYRLLLEGRLERLRKETVERV